MKKLAESKCFVIVLTVMLLCSVLQVNNSVKAADEVTYEGIPTGLVGDDSNTSFPIGFDFVYYGNTYSTAFVSTNGVISFGAGSSTYSNTSFPASIPNAVFSFWDDLIVNQNTIMYKTVGEAPNRQLVMQWTNMFFYGTSTQLGTFQAILFEGTNKIQMQYRTLMGSSRAYGESCTIGIQNSDRSLYTQYSYNQGNAIYEKQAISFTPSGSTYTMNTNDSYQYIYLISPLMPGVPVLSDGALYDGATNVPTNVTVEWSAVDRATSYRVYVANDSNFASLFLNQTTNSTSYQITGLNNLTTYYLRVEAINSYGSNMSNQISFTTASAVQSVPSVSTGAVSNLDYTTLDIGGNLTSLGVPSPSQYGHVYNTTGNPTISDSKTTLGGVYSTGEYSSSLTGLTEGTTYHIRAYATNSAGTSYGEAVTVTTLVSNHAPSAVNDTANVTEDSYVNIDVLDNDSDEDGDTFTITSISVPAHGTAVENPDHTIKYTPEANYDQSDSFTYTISDTYGATSTATVSVTVDAVNDLPSTPSFITPTGTEIIKGGDEVAVSYNASSDIDSSGVISYAVDFYDGNQWINNVYTGTETSFTFTETASVNTDEAKFRVKAIDSDAGESSYVTSSSFLIDSDSPSALTINRSDISWTNNDVTFTVTGGEDVLSGVDERLYRIDSCSWISYTELVTVSTEGIHLVEAKAIDNVGNVTYASDATIYIDKTNPEVPVINASTASFTNSDVTFTITGGADSLSGLNRIDYRIDNGEWLLYNGEVTISAEGVHLLQSKATDNAGNTTDTVSINVKIDKTKPEATLVGPENVSVVYQGQYVEQGVTSSDSLSGVNRTVISGDAVNENVLGTYVITYDVFDNANNKSDTLTRTVNVVDNSAPVITLNGDGEITIEKGDPYVEYYAFAYDDHDGDISADIIISNPVNIWIIGDYQVTYQVTDSSMNRAVPVIRQIHVIDLSIDRKVDSLLEDLKVPGNVAALSEAISEYDEIENDDAISSLQKAVTHIAKQQEESEEFIDDFIEISNGVISQILKKTSFSEPDYIELEETIIEYIQVFNQIEDKNDEVKESIDNMIETLIGAFSKGIPAKAKEDMNGASQLSFSSPVSISKINMIEEIINDILQVSPETDFVEILGNSSLKIGLLDKNSKDLEEIELPGNAIDLINEIGVGMSLEGTMKTLLIPSGTFETKKESTAVIIISHLDETETEAISKSLEAHGMTSAGFDRRIEYSERNPEGESSLLECHQYVTTTFTIPGFSGVDLTDLQIVMIDEQGIVTPIIARIYKEAGMVYATFNQNASAVYSLVVRDSDSSDDHELMPLVHSLGISRQSDSINFDSGITRGELANMISSVLRLKESTGEAVFTDISGYEHKEDIIALVSTGIMVGYGDYTFRPDKTVTKQEMITVLYRMLVYITENSLLKAEVSSGTSDYEDVMDISDWALTGVKELDVILSDDNDSTFNPDDPVSFEQFLGMLKKVLELVGLQ